MVASARGESSRWLLLLVVLGGSLGGLLRWGAGELTGGSGNSSDPGGQVDLVLLAINVGGAFALGLLPAALTLPPAGAREALAAFLGPGMLGGFTTLSAIEVSTRSLHADGQPGVAVLQLVGTLVAAVAAVALARRLAPLLIAARAAEDRAAEGGAAEGGAAEGGAAGGGVP